MVRRQLISDEIWEQNYKSFSDNSLDDTWERQARACSAVEDPSIREKVYEDFKWLLSDFKGIAGGRITANLGVQGREATTFYNCFVMNPSDLPYPDADSIEGIYEMLKAQAHTLKSEGGYGMNFSWIRPNGSYVKGIDSRTPGMLNFMELWDTSSKVITMGSEKVLGGKKDSEKKKIRKGAQMAVCECVAGDTLISTIEGKIKVKDLADTNPFVYCTDGQGNVFVRKAAKVWKTGRKKVVKINLDNDDYLICTPDHEIMLKDGSYKKAGELKFGESVAVLHKRLYSNYFHLSVTGSRKTVAEHVAVAEFKYGKFPKTILLDDGKTFDENSEIVHHIDNNSVNNKPENLELMTRKTHNEIHYEQSCQNFAKHRLRIAAERKGKSHKEYYGPEKAQAISEKRLETREKNGVKPWNYDLKGDDYKKYYKKGFSNQFAANKNHKVVSVIECGYADVYDISVPDFHNFVANGVFVHNCWHPEVEDFIDAKQVEGRLSKFNISVGITEGFMEAVINDQDWHLKFPDTEHPAYEKEWFGNILDWESKGYPVIIHKTLKAKDLWNKITKATYTRNDPGVLFLDIINQYNPFSYGERVVTTNPCFAGDTLVAVADGRGYVPIKKLAEEEKDVPVYSFNVETGNTEVKWGRLPRITGKDKDLIRVHLDNKTFLDVTPNHKFTLLDGTEKEASELLTDDILPSFENLKDSEKDYYVISKNTNEVTNFKITKTEKLEGKHTVYNITVDGNHTVGIITNITSGKQTGVFTPQCGEIPMGTGLCLLFSLNLVKYIKPNKKGDYVFDFETFKKAVKITVRFADNINDISRTPHEAYAKAVREKRRLGIGVLALGSLHYVLGIKFGSDESLKLIKEIFKTKAETELLASAELGKEKGSFQLFDREKYFNTYWWKHLPISKAVKKQIEEIGEMRNSHRAANAPTGNMSIYAGVVSGGIEPIFMKEYARWSIVPEFERKRLREAGFEFPNIFSGEWFETKHMKESKLGTDSVLLGNFEGVEYQVDKNRGLTKKTVVEDWGWSFVKENFPQEKIEQLEKDGVFVTTEDLSVEDHINTLKVIAPFVDQNSSKTVNVPHDYDYDKFKDVYLDAWKNKIKGLTTYRAGTMTAVLESVNNKPGTESLDAVAPKRPKSLSCELHRPKINGKEWVVIVGINEGSPYEIFAGPIDDLSFPSKGKGNLIKKGRGTYTLEMPDMTIGNIIDYLDDNDSAWATRLVSMSLRHGIPLKFIHEQLSKDGFVTDVNKVLARIIKKYIKNEDNINCPSCNSKKGVLQEGCFVCLDCGYGKC